LERREINKKAELEIVSSIKYPRFNWQQFRESILVVTISPERLVCPLSLDPPLSAALQLRAPARPASSTPPPVLPAACRSHIAVLRLKLRGLKSSRRRLVSYPQSTADARRPCLAGRAMVLHGHGLTWWPAGGDEVGSGGTARLGLAGRFAGRVRSCSSPRPPARLFFRLPFPRTCFVLGSDFDSICLQVTIMFRWSPPMVVPSGVAVVVLKASAGAHAGVHYGPAASPRPPSWKVPSQSQPIFPRLRHVFTAILRMNHASTPKADFGFELNCDCRKFAK
jgi:hypothetical protein